MRTSTAVVPRFWGAARDVLSFAGGLPILVDGLAGSLVAMLIFPVKAIWARSKSIANPAILACDLRCVNDNLRFCCVQNGYRPNRSLIGPVGETLCAQFVPILVRAGPKRGMATVTG
jgi:hypothetical protein